MLPAIVLILFFIGAVTSALTLFVAYAVDQHTRRDLSGYIVLLYLLIGFGGAVCGWETLKVLAQAGWF